MDPRFSPPADGGRPQNALTGQLFDVNSGTTDITVPPVQQAPVLARHPRWPAWRPASPHAGSGVGTLGYEWDVDADNGFRPAGLFDMSATTIPARRYSPTTGATTKPNSTATHHLTLYRAAERRPGVRRRDRAMVMGPGQRRAGTGNTDPAMQQATVNLFADMGDAAGHADGRAHAGHAIDRYDPADLDDHVAVSGCHLPDGAAVTISGTAADAGGGVVAGVEVSTDGGSTWHPVTTMSAANTSVTWSYSWIAHGNPTTTIKTRAVDDSGNLEKPGPGTRST